MSPKRQKSGATAAKRREPSIGDLLEHAQACLAQGWRDQATQVYNQIVSSNPADFETLHLLGVGQHMAGDHEGAARSIARALQINPGSAEAHANLGTVLRALNRIDEAVASYDDAIALDPNFANAHYNRGNALLALQRLSDAIASYDRAIALNPANAGALVNRGKARGVLRNLDAALDDFDRALAVDSRHAGAWTCRGDALYQKGQIEAALHCFDKAITLNPRLLDPWNGAAQILMQANKTAEAIQLCHRAIAIHPKSAMALTLLAKCYSRQSDADTALRYLDRALEIDPANDFALSTRIFSLDFATNVSVAEHHRARRDWWTKSASKIPRAQPRLTLDRNPARPLVLGYMSGDYRAISPAYAIRPVLQNHNRSQFEVVCYSTLPADDGPVMESFRTIADRWRDISQLSDDQAAKVIQDDKVDILIDLSGHTQGNRLPLFARKLAPIQVTAWGHATGTGMPTVDYVLTDPVTTPAEARPHYAEKIWDLPCHVIIEPPSPELRASEPPLLRNDYVTYGVFNRVSKYSDPALAVWAQIMRADPTARLVLKDATLEHEAARDGLLKRLETFGFDTGRVQLLGRTPRDEHLAAYGQIDIILDPFPHNGGVSTWEAVYMSVPVVTKLGETPSGRVGGGIMTAIGLPDWVASTDEEYVRIALSKADRLQALRRDLPAMIEATCGPAVYTKAVEAAYRSMWQTWCASDPS